MMIYAPKAEEQTKNPICCGILEKMKISWMCLEDGSKCIPHIKSNSDDNIWRVNHCPSCGNYVRNAIIEPVAQNK